MIKNCTLIRIIINKKYTTEVVAREMTMLDSRASTGSSAPSSDDSDKGAPKDDKFEEDIPF